MAACIMKSCLRRRPLLAQFARFIHWGVISSSVMYSTKCFFPKRQGLKAVLTTNFNCNCYGTRFRFVRDARTMKRLYCSSSGLCWNCNAQLYRSTTASEGSPRVAALFCASCNMIQPLEENLNHFQIMGMEETFDIDVPDLTNSFRNLQRLLHPDKFSNKSETEQNYSAAQSSAVNRAYRVLLKPLSRGLYLLELRGFSIEEGESNIDPVFLMEVMEINEVLADTDDIEDIRRIGTDNAVILNAHLDELKEAFSKADYPKSRETLMRLKYYANIDDKVKEKLGTS